MNNHKGLGSQLSSLEIILKELNLHILEILSLLAEVHIHGSKGAYIQIEKDLKNVSTNAISEQSIIAELLSLLPGIKEATASLISKLNMIRHQLRTHLNAIKGYCEFIIEELENNEVVDIRAFIVSRLASILVITNKMLNLINQLNISDTTSQNLLGTNEERPKNKINFIKNIFPPSPFPSVVLNSSLLKNENVKQLFQRLIQKARNNIIKDKGAIIIVDDIDINRSLLESWLQRRKYNVYTAASGMEALALLETHSNIDIMLLDVMMPVMDGYEVLKQIKSDDRFSDLIVIMISALDEMDSIVHCIKEGAEDYMIKPFNPILLDVKIKACLDKKRLRDTEKAYITALFDELSFAQQIQLSMMPTQEAISDLCSFYGQVIPAKEIGGDFYDWHRLEGDQFSFCIGDVSGKWASAALHMVQIRTILNTLATIYINMPDQLEAFLSHTNKLQSIDNDSSMFVTLFYGILNSTTHDLYYVNAGHWPPFILHKNGSVKALEGYGGLPMGVLENSTYKVFKTTLEKGSMLILYTDGITESMNSSKEMFGLKRLEETLRQCHLLSPQQIVEKLINSVATFTQNDEYQDDITVLVVEAIQ